jgi:hypothetical protein
MADQGHDQFAFRGVTGGLQAKQRARELRQVALWGESYPSSFRLTSPSSPTCRICSSTNSVVADEMATPGSLVCKICSMRICAANDMKNTRITKTTSIIRRNLEAHVRVSLLNGHFHVRKINDWWWRRSRQRYPPWRRPRPRQKCNGLGLGRRCARAREPWDWPFCEPSGWARHRPD